MKTSESRKLISIVIPVFNPNYEFLLETLKSIQCQNYSNYEVLLIVDGDAESTKEIVDRMKDDRFKILINTEGKGLPYSLNRGFKESKGEYIFRMDADDICLPERFAKQVKYLDAHPDIDMVGTFAETFGAVNMIYKSYTDYKDINAELLFKNPIVHPSVAFRKSTVEKYNLQYSTGESEDYRIWIDMAFGYHCKIEVIPEVLLRYRMHEGQATVVKKSSIKSVDEKISKEILDKIGIKLSVEGYKTFFKLRNSEKIRASDLKKIYEMRKEIREALPEYISVKAFIGLVNKMTLKKLL